jgi:hypothetical protein
MACTVCEIHDLCAVAEHGEGGGRVEAIGYLASKLGLDHLSI